MAAKNDEFRSAIDRRLIAVEPSAGLKNRIMLAIEKEKQNPSEQKKTAKKRTRHVLALGLVAGLIMAFGVTVGAGGLPGFENFIAKMGDGFSKDVQPLSEISEYDGI